MNRRIIIDLTNWYQSVHRKPLILHGARRTGKTWAVREFAARAGLKLIELNMEYDPQLRSLFSNAAVEQVIRNLGILFGIIIDSSNSLLFIDEIQACPATISYLRWFYEKMPELPVIAADSLLEFALEDAIESMPVGRITFRYMYPMLNSWPCTHGHPWSMKRTHGLNSFLDHLTDLRVRF